ncbi:DegT/DnrJ/EryC1/StrS family aminotransferase [Leptobacterium sp. I13]|uniref:DegT/DnrJ/EryC1/StrS family aminotransferase n=1 Tax=Leptobacterium meishanense TaxID=3128904 RepID=UPI0030EDEB1B
MITKTKIWLSSPHMGGNEQKYVNDAFETNWIAPLGPNLYGFENDLESYLCEDCHVAAVSSGTAAIHLALRILGISRGDEVLCQSFTFTASANPIIYMGATPIFIDSEADTWNLSPELLEKAILNRISKNKKPQAIIAVHLYGMPYMVEEVREIAQKYEIPIIEDSAEALGSSYLGQKCGTLGDLGILSFNGNKIITTSGGGALVAKNKWIKDKVIFLSTQARDIAPHYEHSHIGYNYRMSNVVAGIGRGQMEVINERVAARRNNFDYYKKILSGYTNISFLEEPDGFFSNRWLTCIITASYEQRERIRIALEKEDIESRPLWKPMHLQPVYKGCDAYLSGVSERLFEKGLCLPSGSSLSQSDIARITEIIIKNTDE